MLINGLLLSKFIQTCHADGGNWTKNNLLIHLDGVFESFFKFFLCFDTLSTRNVQFFWQVITETSCSFICNFYNPRQITKIFFDLLFYTSKNPSPSSSLNRLHCFFLHRCVYTLQHMSEDDNFYLVCRQNQSLTWPLHCNTHCMEHLDHEIFFYSFFPRF